MLLRLLFPRHAARAATRRRTPSAPTFWARPAVESLEGRLAPSDLDPGLAPDPAQTPVVANLPAVSTVAPSVLVISPIAPPSDAQGALPRAATSLMGTLLAAPTAVASDAEAEVTLEASFREGKANTYSITGQVTAPNLNGYTVSFSGIPELQGREEKVNADGSFGTTFGWAPGGATTRTVNVALVAPGGSVCAQCQVTIHQTVGTNK